MESLSFFFREQYRFRLVSFQKTRASRRNKFVEKEGKRKKKNGTISKYIYIPPRKKLKRSEKYAGEMDRSVDQSRLILLSARRKISFTFFEYIVSSGNDFFFFFVLRKLYSGTGMRSGEICNEGETKIKNIEERVEIRVIKIWKKDGWVHWSK